MRLRRTTPLSSRVAGDSLARQCQSELAVIVERRRTAPPLPGDRAARG
jgi:hypothetical protein